MNEHPSKNETLKPEWQTPEIEIVGIAQNTFGDPNPFDEGIALSTSI